MRHQNHLEVVISGDLASSLVSMRSTIRWLREQVITLTSGEPVTCR